MQQISCDLSLYSVVECVFVCVGVCMCMHARVGNDEKDVDHRHKSGPVYLFI